MELLLFSRFRVLAVIDDFSRECLALVADNSLSGVRVARELDRIAERRGYPCLIVNDNGTELTKSQVSKRVNTFLSRPMEGFSPGICWIGSSLCQLPECLWH